MAQANGTNGKGGKAERHEVVIIGGQGGDQVDVREIAAAIGTSPYEVLCRVGARIERIY